MHPDFSHLFHQSSKDLRGHGRVSIPQDSRQWPLEWHTVHYKIYPRFKKIALPATAPTADFFDLVRERKTDRRFSSTVLTVEKLSTLLKYTCGITHEHKEFNLRRAYPSGGALFPLEVYPILFSDVADIASGIYHYNVKDHALDTLEERSFSKDDIARLATYSWVQDAAALFVISAVFWRSQMKYGERGYRYILLEAGHLGQNLYLTSAALGLKCAGLGGTRDKNIESVLHLDGVYESLVYALVVG